MKKISLLLALCWLCFSCQKEADFYTEINQEQYNTYKPVRTLISNSSYLITLCQDKLDENEANTTLIRTGTPTNFHYFILDDSARLENDSTLVFYSEPFVYYAGQKVDQNSGQWLYADFYEEKDTAFFSLTKTGVRFNVDSMPQRFRTKSLPNAEGIYYYQQNQLRRLCKDQSETTFYAMKKDGFYYIPNSGRFLKRFPLSSIE